MEFRRMGKEEEALILPYLEKSKKRMCDYSVVTFLTWREYYKTEFCILEETLYLRTREHLHEEASDDYAYWYPMRLDGQAGERELRYLQEHCGGKSFAMALLDEAEVCEVQDVYGEIPTWANPDWYDYIYDAEQMRNFAGRRYSGKRNHISQFIRNYGMPEFHTIDRENLSRVYEFYKEYIERYAGRDAMAEYDVASIQYTFEHYFELPVVGGYLSVNGVMIGFSIGERKGDTLYVHIEKADIAYKGAYATLVRSFAERFAAEVRYINREEDLGDEGLRRSKQSFYPLQLEKKYMVEIPAE